MRLLHGREVADLKAALKAKKAEMLQTMTGIPDHSFKARAPCGPSVVSGSDPRMSTSMAFAECNIEHATWRPLVCDCSRTLDVSCIKLCRNVSQQLDAGKA